MENKIDLVVTRHEGLLDYLKESGLISDDVIVKDHVTKEDVFNKHVCGILPTDLAAYAASITVVPMDIPKHRRGVELGLPELRCYVTGASRRFIVTEVDYCG